MTRRLSEKKNRALREVIRSLKKTVFAGAIDVRDVVSEVGVTASTRGLNRQLFVAACFLASELGPTIPMRRWRRLSDPLYAQLRLKGISKKAIRSIEELVEHQVVLLIEQDDEAHGKILAAVGDMLWHVPAYPHIREVLTELR